MSKRAFDKIAEGLHEAIALARKKQPKPDKPPRREHAVRPHIRKGKLVHGHKRMTVTV